MRCNKCAGLLVADEFMDHEMNVRCWMARCVNCGNAFDEQSILNKYHPPTDQERKKHPKVREVGVRI